MCFLICVPFGYESYVSLEFHEIHLNLQSLGWKLCVIDSGGQNDTEIIFCMQNARVVLLWEAYEFVERNHLQLLSLKHPLQSHGTKLAFFCDDVHYFSRFRYEQRYNAFLIVDIILATYPHKLKEWFPAISVDKIVWMPHSAASYFATGVSNWNFKETKVLLSGSMTWPYPFRQFCAAKITDSCCHIEQHPGSYGIVININQSINLTSAIWLGYPGYPGDRNNKSIANSDRLAVVAKSSFAQVLQDYPAMVVCGSVFHYLVAKVFEAMAAGCLVILERDSLSGLLSKLGYEEGVHFIGTDYFHLVEDVTRVLNMVSAEPHKHKLITAAAKHRTCAYHTTTVRAGQIHELFVINVMSDITNQVSFAEIVQAKIKIEFQQTGVVYPLPALSKTEAAEAKKLYFKLCDESSDNHTGVLVGKARLFGHLRKKWIMDIARSPTILGPVKLLLGENIMLWVSEFNSKAPNTSHFISWHQDAYYWRYSSDCGQDISQVPIVTVWVGLTEATRANGCMKMILKSHHSIVEHRETPSEFNLLTRGQEISVSVNENDATFIEVGEGHMSIHHSLTHHSSGPNTSPHDFRIGLVFRFFSPTLIPPCRPAYAHLVHGEDTHGHWDHIYPSFDNEKHADILTDMNMKSVQSFTGAKFK